MSNDIWPKSKQQRFLDTTDFSRVEVQFQPKSKQQRFLDTTDFSRVEVQFQPNFATVEEGRIWNTARLKSVVSKKITRPQPL